MNIKKYTKIRKNAEKNGLLEKLDSRYKVIINIIEYSRNNELNDDEVDISLDLVNIETLDCIVLTGLILLNVKEYSFVVYESNNSKYNSKDFKECNHIIEHMSEELKIKFEDKLDVIYELMQR